MGVKNYVKKPVVIQAIQWTGDNLEAINHFMGKANIKNDKFLIIHTLEGDMKASFGDFIIRGVDGEYYPCKPDIFHKTYDLF